jgi:8-oxo-dGTP pyrophosphatase MutT (NUDIX family)
MSAAEEPVEALDREGRALRVVTRAELRRDNLRHRAVYVLVVDAGRRLLVHRRAEWKDVYPGRWDVAFGGVVRAGEGPDETARRELAEEAGMEASLRRLGGGSFEDERARVLGDVYLAESAGPFSFSDGEVVETAWVPTASLRDWLGRHRTCDDSVALSLPLLDAALGEEWGSGGAPPREGGA